MQQPLITIEGGKPKKRLGLVSSWLICAIALPLPVRARIYFVFLVNFIYNHVLATTRLIISFLGRRFADAMIFLAYYLVLGPLALFGRLLRPSRSAAAPGGAFFSDKEPQDSTAERFERQY